MFEHYGSSSTSPGHAIILDHSKKAIVLTIRGSISNLDWITNSQAEYIEHTIYGPNNTQFNGLVHKGILRAAKSIWDGTRDTIMQALESNPGYKLVVTGHSLGAGTAGMLGLLLFQDSYFRERDFSIIALAPPLIFSEEFNEALS